MAKVSIIVPIYKVEQYIDRCINSILSQSLKEIELILVDDGSPDNCPIICDQYAEKDSRVKVIHQNNSGVSSARNAGLSIAAGKYIGFVDADDYIDRYMFEKLYKSAVENDASLVCCDLNYIDEKGLVENNWANGFEIVNSEELFKIMFDTSAYLRMGVWNKMYKHEIIKDERFDTTQHMAEDLLFLLKVIPKANKIVYLKESLYFYFRQREDSATSKSYGSFEKERVKNTHYMADFIRYNYPKIYPQAVSYKCINGDLTAINKMIDAHIKDMNMIKLVQKDLKDSMSILNDSGISKKKLAQIIICSKSYLLYKLLYRIIK